MTNPLTALFPGGLSLSTVLGTATAAATGIYQATGNPYWGAIVAGLTAIVLPEEPKK
jgi:hypothetical protein